MEGDELIVIRSFDNVIDAYQIKNVLENEGIAAYVADEYVTTLNPLYSNLVHGIKLRIRRSDLDLAEKTISQLQDVPLTNDNGEIIACPKCSSVRVLYHLKSSKNPAGIFSILLALLTGSYPLYSKDICRCQNCGFEFEMKKTD